MRPTRSRFRLALLLAAASCLAVLAPGPALAQGIDPLTFNWNSYGKEVAAGMPPSIRSPLERLRFVADAVGAKIRQQGIIPNVSVVGRGISGVRFGSPTLGTCDDVSESLRDALYGAGVKPDDVMLVVSSRGSPIQGTGIDLVNMSHASLIVFVDRKPYVFDLWMHGADTGEFSDFSKSVWSALDPAAYLSTLKRWGYGQFRCHGCTDATAKSAEDFLASLGRKPVPPAVPPAAPRRPNPPSADVPPEAVQGKKACAALMQAISTERASEDAEYGKYWVVFTRPYAYDAGHCVGAHQVWRKKPDGSPPYAEVEYFSPENPARIPIGEIKSSWKKKHPALDWGL